MAQLLAEFDATIVDGLSLAVSIRSGCERRMSQRRDALLRQLAERRDVVRCSAE